jgi:hypothetical protein
VYSPGFAFAGSIRAGSSPGRKKENLMPRSSESQLQDAAILTRAVENVFRKLIRFLMGRISLVKLQEMIRFIFVEEAENQLRAKHPHKNVPLTKLAVLSGLDTRTLIKIRNSEQYRKPLYEESTFLREFTPGARILDVWRNRPPYMDNKRGEPRVLNISGADNSFEALFADSIKSRGITAMSLLNRMVESGAVEMDRDSGTVRVTRVTYLPSSTADEMGSIEMGFSAIANMIDTVVHNVNALSSGEERLYQQGIWTYRLTRQNQARLRTRLRQLLTETDQAARDILPEFEESYEDPGLLTAGISMFYFEENL